MKGVVKGNQGRQREDQPRATTSRSWANYRLQQNAAEVSRPRAKWRFG